MKYILVLVTLISLVSITQAQRSTITFSGRVRNIDSKPISNFSIRVQETYCLNAPTLDDVYETYGVTNSKGDYAIEADNQCYMFSVRPLGNAEFDPMDFFPGIYAWNYSVGETAPIKIRNVDFNKVR